MSLITSSLKTKHNKAQKTNKQQQQNTITTITTTTTIIIIIIAFKDTVRDFFTISSQRRELSPTRTLKWPRRNRVQITCNTSSAYHVQHVVLRATWYEGTAQLLSLTELKSHLFQLYFVGWIIKPMKEGRKPEYQEKTPSDELQKMPHTTARIFKPQARSDPAQ